MISLFFLEHATTYLQLTTFIHHKPMKSMLKYMKTILEKVSFDARIFEKELRKAIDRLSFEELQELKGWCYQRFNKQIAILDRCFQHAYTGVIA